MGLRSADHDSQDSSVFRCVSVSPAVKSGIDPLITLASPGSDPVFDESSFSVKC